MPVLNSVFQPLSYACDSPGTDGRGCTPGPIWPRGVPRTAAHSARVVRPLPVLLAFLPTALAAAPAPAATPTPAVIPTPTEDGIASSASVGNMTIRVAEAKWYALSDLDPHAYLGPVGRFQKVFTVTFDIQGAPVPAGGRASNPYYLLNVFLVSPSGERLPGAPVPGKPEMRQWQDGVDPRWDPIVLDCTYQDPSARRAVSMPESPVLEFKSLPIPHEAGKPIDLNQALLTPRGTRVTLEKIELAPRQGSRTPGDTNLVITGRWLPPVDMPELCAALDLGRHYSRETGLQEPLEVDQGSLLQDRTHHYGLTSSHDELDPKHSTPGSFSIYSGPPSAEAKTLTVRIEVRERVPGAPVPASDATHLKWDLHPAEIQPPAPAGAAPQAPLATVPLGDGKLILENMVWNPWGGWLNWTGQVLVQDPRPQNSDREWMNTGLMWYSGDRNSGTISGTGGIAEERQRWLWKAAGTPITPNEKIWLVSPRFDKAAYPTPPQKATIEMNWTEVKRDRFSLSFTGLPIPAVGATVDADSSSTAGDYGRFVVRKVGCFDETHTLSPRLAARMGGFQPPYGMAVVVEYLPAPSVKDVAWKDSPDNNSWMFQGITAEDDMHRSLLRNCDGPAPFEPTQDLLSTGATTGGYRMTVFLLPPRPGVKTFTLQMQGTHVGILRKQDTVFKDIPLPPPTDTTPPH